VSTPITGPNPVAAADATNSTSGSSNSSTTNKVGNGLGQDAFLQLLVTQLQHQDPLQPQDSSAFVAQLAQFSSLEQLTQINTSMQKLVTLAGGSSTTNNNSTTGANGTGGTNNSSPTSGSGGI
jgi:flagellar hook assembly protein FlgD